MLGRTLPYGACGRFVRVWTQGFACNFGAPCAGINALGGPLTSHDSFLDMAANAQEAATLDAAHILVPGAQGRLG